MDLERSLSPKAKPSSHLLNLMKCKEKAVRCREYVEAEAYRRHIAVTSNKE